jgi:signal transduction histidine kinase
VLGLVSVAALARFLARRRLQRRLRVVEQKLALERERSRIARDIHDQLGANLTHITLLSTDEDPHLPAPAQERFRAIAASSNELVQSVDAIVWAVNPRHSTLESLARYLSRFAGDFLTAAGVTLRLDLPVNLPDVELNPELRHNVFLAAREALNNSVRHAKATEVQLTIQVRTTDFQIILADNGHGFNLAAKQDGDGLENLRRRLSDCHGTCEITTGPESGTIITFTLPLSTAP